MFKKRKISNINSCPKNQKKKGANKQKEIKNANRKTEINEAPS